MECIISWLSQFHAGWWEQETCSESTLIELNHYEWWSKVGWRRARLIYSWYWLKWICMKQSLLLISICTLCSLTQSCFHRHHFQFDFPLMRSWNFIRSFELRWGSIMLTATKEKGLFWLDLSYLRTLSFFINNISQLKVNFFLL